MNSKEKGTSHGTRLQCLIKLMSQMVSSVLQIEVKGRMTFRIDSGLGRYRSLTALLLTAFIAVVTPCMMAGQDPVAVKVGTQGSIGCRPSPKRVKRLVIDKPGVYENYLVDGEWDGSTLVKISADNVTLRNCEVRHGKHNAITVYAKDVVIESCKIHDVLAGTFGQPHDAHGITGSPTNLIIRNCDIGLTSGDSIQFAPDRSAWDNVLIENCTLWTGPLPADAAGFKKGERPGENAIDTKQGVTHPRSRMKIRNCLLQSWNQPAQMSNMAALNLKNHVQVTVENCVFRDNEICFRVRGGAGDLGGAHVTINNCAVYDSLVAVRSEDKAENLKIRRLGIGGAIQRKLQVTSGGTGAGYENIEEYAPPPYETVMEKGLPR